MKIQGNLMKTKEIEIHWKRDVLAAENGIERMECKTLLEIKNLFRQINLI